MITCRLSSRFRAVVLFAVIAGGSAVTAFQPPLRTPDRFVLVNGIRLHWLDWGGSGAALVFLAGLGDSVHRFDRFAAKFVDRFHALGFTRRGQEESAKAVGDFDLRALADDIRGFLDAENIQRAVLIGHSIAGAEMTMFAEVYPERVTALVYLDAAYDNARAYELALPAGLAKPNPDVALERIERASRVHPNYSKVTVPALAFFVLYDAPPTPQYGLAFRVLDASGYKREQIDAFKTGVKRATVVEWHDTNHMFFDDPKHSDEAALLIRQFLADVH